MKLTICQNDACDNGKLVSLIVSETLKKQQDLDKRKRKKVNLNTRDFINIFSKRKTGFTGRQNFFKLNFI